MTRPRLDEVGIWTLVKEEIVSKYASAYSRIMASRFHHIYIDGFCGPGYLIPKSGEEVVKGSPLRVLDIDPKFQEYHFIDQEPTKIEFLQTSIGGRKDVTLYCEDCNQVLVNSIFPEIKYTDFKRALCFLDPYGVHLHWEVFRKAAEMGTIELIINFSISAINRTVLRKDFNAIDPIASDRMTCFWGDNSWLNECYSLNLFGDPMKDRYDRIAQVFRRRLKDIAGFAHVPEPVPMRNSRRSIVYFLFLAAQYPESERIFESIFKRYRKKGMQPDGV
jgi:three-Cys-motif partner protein